MAKQRTLGREKMNNEATVRLEIRSISSPDVDFYSWDPTTNADVFFLVELEIGAAGVDGADLFQVVVATPEALRAKAKTGSTVIRERSTIVVSNFDWHEIRRVLETVVCKCEAESWVTSTLRLQKYFKWEYEDYQLESGT
jgi:hypothetical protein